MNKPTYEELEAQLHAVVAENAALKDGMVKCTEAVDHWNSWADAEDKTYLDIKTPATDAAISALRAEGVDMLVARRMKASDIARQRDDLLVADSIEGEAIRAQMFANELRQSVQVKGVQS